MQARQTHALPFAVRHHSAVELTQRAQTAGLPDRERDSTDHRRVHLTLTAHGRQQLEVLTREHLPRVYSLAATLKRTLPQSTVGGKNK